MFEPVRRYPVHPGGSDGPAKLSGSPPIRTVPQLLVTSAWTQPSPVAPGQYGNSGAPARLVKAYRSAGEGPTEARVTAPSRLAGPHSSRVANSLPPCLATE